MFEQTTELVYNDAKDKLEEQKSTRLLFPRYHQRRAVRRLLAAVQAEGAGRRYLIKHSAAHFHLATRAVSEFVYVGEITWTLRVRARADRHADLQSLRYM